MREAAAFIAGRSESAGSGFLRNALQFMTGSIRRWRNRRTVKQLAEFDDHMLADLGVSRDDVRSALSQPFIHDPSVDLDQRARANRWLSYRL